MIHIQTPVPTQLLQLAQLFDHYRVFYRKNSNLKAAISFLKQRMIHQDSVIFIAQEQEKIIGFTQLYPLFSSINLNRIWLLNDLYVLPKWRGQKISKLLIKAAQRHCLKTKAHSISLETEKSNKIGNLLYPKMGFVLDQEHNYYQWKNLSASFVK